MQSYQHINTALAKDKARDRMDIPRDVLIPQNWVILISIGVGVIISTVYLTRWIINTIYGIQCKKWPKVKGKIINTPHANDVYGSDGNSSEPTVRVGYKVRIKYEYKVNGIEFENITLSFNNSVANNPLAVEMYENGDEVDVYYNPKYPNISVLIR
jgi:hypothetical protein